MAEQRQLPLPGSPEAHAEGCTCPAPEPGQDDGPPMPLDRECPVHGLAEAAEKSTGEQGRIDTEGDITDKATERELRRR